MSDWTIHTHEDPRYLSINNGGNDTLLRASEGASDQALAAEFAAWVQQLRDAAQTVARRLAAGASKEWAVATLSSALDGTPSEDAG